MPPGVLRIVGGSLRNRRLRVLRGSRPTSERAREALFDILGPWIAGKRVLELYAGSGAVSFEALSRGAAAATAAERDASALEENCRRLTVEVEVLAEPAERAVARLSAEGRRFDLIFADPPYDAGPPVELARCAGLLAPGGVLVLQSGEERDGVPAPPGLVRTRLAAYGRNVFSFYTVEPGPNPPGAASEGRG
jgi:16S rRNA (guanine966-N2)-methyltransferase